jgi:DNA-binding CsgD family transcriptional regulator
VTAEAVVIEGTAANTAVERLCADLAARGLRISSDWRAAAPGLVCTGVVDDDRSAEQAVLAALAGAQLVVAATGSREVIDRLCDDLRRLGPLDHRINSSGGEPALSAEERALLDRLLAGDSLGQAAAAVHMSRRTADRRLASARTALGVTTTAELLAAAARLRP